MRRERRGKKNNRERKSRRKGRGRVERERERRMVKEKERQTFKPHTAAHTLVHNILNASKS